nr:hypothetical protein [Peristeroidobacter soli]
MPCLGLVTTAKDIARHSSPTDVTDFHGQPMPSAELQPSTLVVPYAIARPLYLNELVRAGSNEELNQIGKTGAVRAQVVEQPGEGQLQMLDGDAGKCELQRGFLEGRPMHERCTGSVLLHKGSQNDLGVLLRFEPLQICVEYRTSSPYEVTAAKIGWARLKRMKKCTPKWGGR